MSVTAEYGRCTDIVWMDKEARLTVGKVYRLRATATAANPADHRTFVEVKDDRGGSFRLLRSRFEIVNEPVQKPDDVNHPAHYGGDTPYEAIKVIEAWQLGFNLGNVVKYISRAGKKTDDAVEDLKKAAFYLDREIANLETK